MDKFGFGYDIWLFCVGQTERCENIPGNSLIHFDPYTPNEWISKKEKSDDWNVERSRKYLRVKV